MYGREVPMFQWCVVVLNFQLALFATSDNGERHATVSEDLVLSFLESVVNYGPNVVLLLCYAHGPTKCATNSKQPYHTCRCLRCCYVRCYNLGVALFMRPPP